MTSAVAVIFIVAEQTKELDGSFAILERLELRPFALRKWSIVRS